MLHEKYHSSNHHTSSAFAHINADVSLDAFASHEAPFQGDFVVNGTFTSLNCDDKIYASNFRTTSAIEVSGTSYGIEGYGKVRVNGDIQVNHLILTDTTLSVPLSDAFLTSHLIYANNSNKRHCFRLWDINKALSAVSLPPYFVIQPSVKSSVVEGNNITFTCSAIGSNIRYQWYRDNNKLHDETKNTLTQNINDTQSVYRVEAITDDDTINGVKTVMSVNVILKEKPFIKEDFINIPFDVENNFVIDVLANDLTYGQNIRIIKYTEPQYGILNFDEKNNIFLYRCKSVYKGQDSFQYTVKDFLNRDSTVTVRLSSTITQPIATDKTLSVNLKTPTQINVFDGDTGGNVPYIILYNAKSLFGTVIPNQTSGLWTYIPSKDFKGSDTFKYTLSGATGLTSTATITLTSVYQLPQAKDDLYPVGLNKKLTFSVFVNDTLKTTGYYIKDYTQPLYGILNLENKYTGEFTYEALSGFIESDSFMYTLIDDAGSESTANVNLSTALPNNWQYGAIQSKNNEMHAATWANLRVDKGVHWREIQCNKNPLTLRTDNGDNITTGEGDEIQ